METTIKSSKVLYTAKTHTVGGRGHGKAKSSDGHLDIQLSTPGTNGAGTNPEQLFAAGWSACFEAAMSTAAKKLGVKLSDGTYIDAEVDLCLDNEQYFLQARLNVHIPGLEKEAAQKVVEAAHHICPYSKAIKGNIHVETYII